MSGSDCMKLTTKQEKFCLEYAGSGNATQAYKAAGYSAKSDTVAAAESYKLLRNPKVKARIGELAAEMADAKIANAREIQETLTSILRGEIQEEMIVVEGCGDGISQATMVEKAPNLKDRIKAGETLAKMQGAFGNTIKLEMTVPVFGGEADLED